MCLAIPSKVLQIDGEQALVECDGIEVRVSAAMMPDLAVGDHVIIHAGFILQRLEEDERLEIEESRKLATIDDL